MAILHTQSQSVFDKRIQDFGLETYKANMHAKGWKTVGAFATCCGFNPDKVEETDFKEHIVKKMIPSWNGLDDEPAHVNNFRQLFFDCLQANMAETRARHDPRAESTGFKIPRQDRLDRRKALQNHLKDTVPEIMDPEMDPAWGPEDELVAMYSVDLLGEYMGPDQFPTRRQEKLLKAKKPKNQAAGAHLWKMITGEEVEDEEKLYADTSEFHLLEQAFKRRGILLHTSGLMGYMKHEEWRRHLWKAMKQETIYAGEAAPGVADVLRADKRIWLLLAEKTLDGGIQLKAGKLPLEEALPEILKKTEVDRLLMVRERKLSRAEPDETPVAGPKRKAKKGKQAQGASAETNTKNREENMERQIT